jgi:hypothetical protein
MPINVDYSKVVIYKIVCKNLDITECYVGHTTNFTKRKYTHHMLCTDLTCKNSHLKVYQMIRNNGNWENWEMIEIEKYPCNDFNEARSRERYWYEKLNSKLNSIKPIETKEERKLRKHEYDKIYDPIYYQSNKEEIKAKVKKYADNNKELICKRTKTYRENNKEEIQAKKAKPIVCECGITATTCHYQRHRRTKLHQELMDAKNNK